MQTCKTIIQKAESDNTDTSTQLILKLLAALVITFAFVAMVTAVTVTPAAHTVPSAPALHVLVTLAGLSCSLVVLTADGALAELTVEALLAAEVDDVKDGADFRWITSTFL